MGIHEGSTVGVLLCESIMGRMCGKCRFKSAVTKKMNDSGDDNSGDLT